MPTKQEIRKYIHNVKSCNLIDVFYDPFYGDYWFHFIGRKGNIVGYCVNFKPCDDDYINTQVKNAKKYATFKEKVQLDAGDPALKTLQKVQKQAYIYFCKIVRKNGKWEIVGKPAFY